MHSTVKHVAVIGAGVIGSGWVARFLANGLSVTAWDPSEDAPAHIRQRVANAWVAMPYTTRNFEEAMANFSMADTVEQCVAQADLVQESAPENLVLKIDLHARISRAAPAHALIASSTSGLLPSEFLPTLPGRSVVWSPRRAMQYLERKLT